MSRHIPLALILVSVFAAVQASALAAGYAPNGSNVCLSTDLTVTTAAGTGAAANTVTATVVALGVPRQRVSRLHLDLEVQQRTATAWVAVVTPGHKELYTSVRGSRIDRKWTLHEDAGPIAALLASHVQVRVYGKFTGVCRGESFGPPLLFGLTAPMLASSPAA